MTKRSKLPIALALAFGLAGCTAMQEWWDGMMGSDEDAAVTPANEIALTQEERL